MKAKTEEGVKRQHYFIHGAVEYYDSSVPSLRTM